MTLSFFLNLCYHFLPHLLHQLPLLFILFFPFSYSSSLLPPSTPYPPFFSMYCILSFSYPPSRFSPFSLYPPTFPSPYIFPAQGLLFLPTPALLPPPPPPAPAPVALPPAPTPAHFLFYSSSINLPHLPILHSSPIHLLLLLLLLFLLYFPQSKNRERIPLVCV